VELVSEAVAVGTRGKAKVVLESTAEGIDGIETAGAGDFSDGKRRPMEQTAGLLFVSFEQLEA